ncbi:MAG: glutathionylspermidine synthase family protein [Nitrospirae bacterium]|nr:glutathionylspermidine synthase family protein [Nitrospirota bacterium]
MKRLTVSPRNNWQQRMEEIGFTFHTPGSTYWQEDAYYEFSNDQVDHLEAVTEDLHAICLEAVDHVVKNNLFLKMGITEAGAALVRDSWSRADRSLYGRFDLVYDSKQELKLLEYNADTPTALFETAVVQWVWLQERFPEMDQFNSVHEKLMDAFGAVASSRGILQPFYFACAKDHEEDFVTVEYLRDVAFQTGFDARHIFMEDIGYSSETNRFYDLEENEIRCLFKLYPWEWLLAEDFGPHISGASVAFFEPAWKMVLSNKGTLAVLWEMYPDHPNLLPAFFEPERLKDGYVRKPLFSREGANILMQDSRMSYREETDGTYGQEGYIYQKIAKPPCFDGNYAIIGSWVVNGLPAGIGIREDDTPITKNTSRFVPHLFRPNAPTVGALEA